MCLRGPSLPLPYLFICCIYLFITAGECQPSLHPAPWALSPPPGCPSWLLLHPVCSNSTFLLLPLRGQRRLFSGWEWAGSPCPPSCLQAWGSQAGWQSCGGPLRCSIPAGWELCSPHSCTTGAWLLLHQQSQGRTLPLRSQPLCQSTPMMSVNRTLVIVEAAPRAPPEQGRGVPGEPFASAAGGLSPAVRFVLYRGRFLYRIMFCNVYEDTSSKRN